MAVLVDRGLLHKTRASVLYAEVGACRNILIDTNLQSPVWWTLALDR
jgi:hypothetical protein